ncbi:sugar phosphate isomerase/epimerase family protein [Pseudonocardia sp.]|uniref:sugar phosphate isomerase/epimerase family protein n=1 Tax=Pseudonocardia sp. TaxID=60912 RepID=UPI003D099D79
MADRPELVASFFTLTGAGFAEEPRHGFVQRCVAAAEAGFAGVGMHAEDLPRTRAQGLDAAQMCAVLADTGLRLVEIEFLGGWVVEPDEVVLEHTVAGIEAVADAFGGRHVSAGEFRDGALDTDPDLDAAADRLRALALRLRRRGLLVAVEAFPWSALRDAGTAVEVLRRAGAPNAGLLVDVWHFANGGADPSLLADLPGCGIAAVQLNDGPRVHADFLHHARTARRLPGEGELDVVGLVRAVDATGFRGPYCVEVNTPQFRALPVGEAAARAAAAATAVLAAAGVGA